VRAPALVLMVLLATLPACSSTLNTPLAMYNASAGYRYTTLASDGREDTLVILAFSGGGTRAAAFSFGLLEALRDTRYLSAGSPRRPGVSSTPRSSRRPGSRTRCRRRTGS